MSPGVEENVVHEPTSYLEARSREFRFMRPRGDLRADRNGDPLDGVINLFDVAIVLAVGFLLAALAGLGLSGLVSSKSMTVVTNPGQPDMQVITKNGTTITKFNLQSGQVSGTGSLVGQLYKLADGTLVYVPSGDTGTGTTGTPAPSASVTPAVTPTPAGVPTPTPATTGGTAPLVPNTGGL